MIFNTGNTRFRPVPTPHDEESRGGFMLGCLMVILAWAIGVACGFWFATPAAAGERDYGAAASAEAQANVSVNTKAYATGGGATINETKQAPALGGLALGGGHPCAYAPATAQFSVLGGGAGIGGMKVDSACMLMVMGAAGDSKAYAASQYMLAARDPAACNAMQMAGIVSGCVTPNTGGVTTTSGGRCDLVNGQIIFRASSASARTAELAACKARY